MPKQIWMNKKTGDLVLVWPIYEQTQEFKNHGGLTTRFFWNSGCAVQNKYGVTFLFNDGWQPEFEYIGEL